MKQEDFIGVEGDHQIVNRNLVTNLQDFPAFSLSGTLLVEDHFFHCNFVISVFIRSTAYVQREAHNTAAVLGASVVHIWKFTPRVLIDIIAVDIFEKGLPKETGAGNDKDELFVEASQAKTISLAEDGPGLCYHIHCLSF